MKNLKLQVTLFNGKFVSSLLTWKNSEFSFRDHFFLDYSDSPYHNSMSTDSYDFWSEFSWSISADPVNAMKKYGITPTEVTLNDDDLRTYYYDLTSITYMFMQHKHEFNGVSIYVTDRNEIASTFTFCPLGF